MLHQNSLFQGFTPVSASPTVKTMEVIIGEGNIDQDNLSKAINIPNLRNIVSTTTNTGSISHSISGERVTINASGGIPSRTVDNSQKESTTVSQTQTSTNDSFPSTIYYNSGGLVDI